MLGPGPIRRYSQMHTYRFNSMVATRRRWNVGYFALWLCPGRREGGMKSRDPEKLDFIIKSIEKKGIREEMWKGKILGPGISQGN